MKKCPNCNAENFNTFTVCIECGVSLEDEEIIPTVDGIDIQDFQSLDQTPIKVKKLGSFPKSGGDLPLNKPLLLTRVKKKGAAPAQASQEIEATKEGLSCPNCNANNDPGFKFCGACGVALDQAQPKVKLCLVSPTGNEANYSFEKSFVFGKKEGDVLLYEDSALPESKAQVVVMDNTLRFDFGLFQPEKKLEKVEIKKGEDFNWKGWSFSTSEGPGDCNLSVKSQNDMPSVLVNSQIDNSFYLLLESDRVSVGANSRGGRQEVKVNYLGDKVFELDGDFRILIEKSELEASESSFWLGGYHFKCSVE